MNKSSKIKDILYTLAFPAVMLIIMEIIVFSLKDRHIIYSMLDVKTLIRNTGEATVIALALSFNLSCGRLDLSLGAQRLAGTIVGGVLAINMGLSGVWLLIFAIAFGFLFGLITGIAFVTLRVPPMVLGIGVGLALECIPYAVSEGKGLNIFGVAGTSILSESTFVIGVVIIIGIFVNILLNNTVFGYQMRAIQGSQWIALNSGINIFASTVMCYALAGALVCVAGILNVSYTTQMASALGLTSNGTVLANMFPMVPGGYIGRKTNQATGIIVAALTVKIFTYGLVLLELSEANSSVASNILFVAFLVFLANEAVFRNKRSQRERIAQAIEKKKKLGLA